MNDTRCRVRWRPVILTIVFMSSLSVVLHIRYNQPREVHAQRSAPHKSQSMHLVVVSCGRPNYQGVKDFSKPLDLSLTMIKSAAMFAKSRLHIHIFTENEMKALFVEEIQSWPHKVQERLKYSIYDADYTDYLPTELIEEWKTWYKPCGSFRLFLPMIMENIADAAIYADSDVVFVKPIDELWHHLQLMEDRQVAAISPTAGHPIDVLESNVNFVKHSTGSFQINSGVMLMNFTRILNAQWRLFHDVKENEKATAKYGIDLLLQYYKEYKGKAEHDQKLLNIIFHYNPDLLYQLPCCWNFKNNFCTDNGNVCEYAETNGAGAVHGIAGAFFGDSNPIFRGLYKTFSEYKFGDDIEKKLLRRFLAHVGTYGSNTYCGKKSHIIVNPLRKSISEVDFMKNQREKS